LLLLAALVGFLGLVTDQGHLYVVRSTLRNATYSASLAAAANFLMGEADEQVPAVLIKGLPEEDSKATASELIRPLEDDLFR